MKIPTIDANGYLTNCDDLPEVLPLRPVMTELYQQLKILIFSGLTSSRFKVYAEIWVDFLRCSSLLSLHQQKAVVDTTLSSCLFGSKNFDLALGQSRELQITSSTQRNLMSDYPKCSHSEMLSIGQREFSMNLVSAYRFSQHTFKLFAFFSAAFVSSSHWEERQRALREFINYNQHPNLKALEEKIDEIAKSLVVVMKQVGLKKPMEKKRMKKKLKTAINYELKFKEWVETAHFDAIYLRAVEIFKNFGN